MSIQVVLGAYLSQSVQLPKILMARIGTQLVAAGTVKVVAAGLGAAVGGPLGGAVGGWLGEAVGGSFAKLAGHYASKGGEKVAEKLLDTGSDSLLERLKQTPAADLESVYRESLRLSLEELRSMDAGAWEDWFANWELCLNSGAPLSLKPVGTNQMLPDRLDGLFQSTLKHLDAQGAAIRRKDISLILQTRDIPAALMSALNERLPDGLSRYFDLLIVQSAYEPAWREVQGVVDGQLAAAVARVEAATERLNQKMDVLPQISEDAAATRRDLSAFLELARGVFQRNENEGRVSREQLKEKDAEITRMTEELQKLQVQLAARAAIETNGVKVSDLIAAGDLEGALRLKKESVAKRRTDAQMLPQDLYELGQMHELRFEWAEALEVYREAWEREPKEEYGLSYASVAQRQNRFREAIETYEALVLHESTDGGRAALLNNLGILYHRTGRLQQAENAYGEALPVLREFAKAHSDVYPLLAKTLNNLADLYSDNQRMQEAETTYSEALTLERKLAEANPDAYGSEVAHTLTHLARVYHGTQRLQEATDACVEALSIRRALAKISPERYRPEVAKTLNSLAIIYRSTEQAQESEEAHVEALSIYRRLAATNPDAYLPNVATTLNNLANLYSNTRQLGRAEEFFIEALSIFRRLDGRDSEVYASDVAATLSNLGSLCLIGKRMSEAENYSTAAENVLEPLWRANPPPYGDLMGRILLVRAVLYQKRGEVTQACAAARRASKAAYDASLTKAIRNKVEQLGCEAEE